MKFLIEVIHEQNSLLALAADTIDELRAENIRLNAQNSPNKIKMIKDLLWDKDLDVAKLARRINRSRTWTSLVLYGIKKSDFTRQAIANTLGVSVEELWPENGHKKAA